MKPKANLFSFKTLVLGISFLIAISQVDGNTLAKITECQELLKGHLNYSDPLLTPMAARFVDPFSRGIFDKANRTIFDTYESKSVADVVADIMAERNEEMKVQLTIEQFHREINRWGFDILICVHELARKCAKEPMKSEIVRLENRVISMMTYYDLPRQSFAQINATEVYEKIAQDKKFLVDFETTQIDLCASGDVECQDCLEEKVDRYYTEGVTCHKSRNWHIIKYKPIPDNQCRSMRHTRVVTKLESGGNETSY